MRRYWVRPLCIGVILWLAACSGVDVSETKVVNTVSGGEFAMPATDTPTPTETPTQTPTASFTPSRTVVPPLELPAPERKGSWSDTMAASPDGRNLAVLGTDGLHVYDLDGMTERFASRWQEWLDGVAYSPDGEKIAAGAWDSSWILYGAESGKKLGIYGKHPGSGLSPFDNPAREFHLFTRVAFSPDGTMIAARGWNAAVYLWDATTGKQIRKMKDYFGTVRSLCFSPDGSLLAALVNDHFNSSYAPYGKKVNIWDVASGDLLQIIADHDIQIKSIKFSPDGGWFAAGYESGDIGIWNTPDFRQERQLHGGDPVLSVDFSADGRNLAVGTSRNLKYGELVLWDFIGGEKIRTFGYKWDRGPSSVLFLPDGRSLLVRLETYIHIWDASAWTAGE